jgi:hypothetical protein
VACGINAAQAVCDVKGQTRNDKSGSMEQSPQWLLNCTKRDT